MTLRIGAKDFPSDFSTSILCAQLAEKVKKEVPTEGKRILLFFGGKEMKPDQPIGQYLSEDAVVIAYLRNQEPS